MEFLDKLKKRIENLIEEVNGLKTENSELKSKLNNFKEKTVNDEKMNEEIKNKVLGMIEMIDNMNETEQK